ncbi:carbohydrate ABC transporter permease [Lawsonibacter sp.]|uniref:carbohydrate ABC transporter permease n=1 Tax=Lawsonibacter sp. TaxID=2185275 RepID=UPI002582AE26|nr:carbohydrate ABC transporter permease [Lawsonibacter sp.]MCI6399235.1 carbohydrate ABC transporter permease [Lawsonibacter sp.]MDY2977297.1 carbohydrate ABC transporter permease [Oscillospiraceae bacterium]
MNRVATLHTRRRSLRRQRRGVGITVVTALIALVFFFPVLIAVLNSFKDKGEIIASALTLPQAPTLENYRTVLEASDFPTAFLNSCLVTGGGIVLNLIVSTLAGYALARWNSVWADILTLLFLSSMFVPFHTIMISLLTTAKGMHLTGHIYGLILIYCGLQCPIPIFLIKGFVDSVPKELEEAAMIDGCGTVRLFFSVVLPMLKPILATVAVLNALWIWNDFLLPYLILAKPVTIPLSQMYFYGQYNQQWNLIMAGFVVSTIPVVLFFLLMQKHIINGIAAGAVKG